MTVVLAGPEDADRVREFIQLKAGVPTPPGPTQVLGFIDDDDNSVVGGWLFERYTGVTGSVHAHWAASRPAWLTRAMLNITAMYIFDQLGVNVVFGIVRGSDAHGRIVAEKLGFEKVTALKGYFPDDDLVIYSLTKQDCRWLPSEFKEDAHGQKEQAASGA